MRRCFHLLCLSSVVSGLTVGISPLQAEKPDRPVDDWLSAVSQKYAEEGWLEKPRFRPQGYMRPADDKGWQTRMLALRAVVSQGRPSIRPLLNALASGDDSQRIFAAQALSYLGSSVPVEPLLFAARGDKVASVRLYADDALGMRGDAAKTVPWESLRKREKNQDVKKHIGYAIERKNFPVEKKGHANADRLESADDEHGNRRQADSRLRTEVGRRTKDPAEQFSREESCGACFHLRRYLTRLSRATRAVARKTGRNPGLKRRVDLR